MKQPEIKIVRTLMNQIIIGKVTETSHLIKIKDPYNVALMVEGLEIYPMDQEIVGTKIPEISLSKENLMYWTQPSEDLINSYINATTGIEIKTSELIV